MATSKPASKTGLPEGFVSPFRVVAQATRHDCGLAAVGTLTGVSLDEVWAAAIKIGLPKIGQYFVTEEHIAKLLMQLGGLVGSRWKEFTSFDAMPAVALLWVDADPKDADGVTGRTIVFHHVRGLPDKYPSFSYCLDGYTADVEKQVVTDLTRYSPTAYLEVTQKAGNGGKAK